MTTIEKNDYASTISALTCPITLDIFVDPVLASDGYTYERVAITDWIDQYYQTSPMTRQFIELKPNRIVKQLVDQY